MMQQINLYQPMFRQQKKIFSAVTMLQIIAIFVVVLTAIYAYSSSRLRPFQAELANQNNEFNRLTKQVEIYRNKFPARERSKVLADEIARLSRELEHRRKIQAVLESGSFGNTRGFSDYFEALARGYTNGAWLTTISIANGGSEVTLAGKTVNPELVPVYIKKLSDSQVFKKKSFNELDLSRSDKDPHLIDFRISTGS